MLADDRYEYGESRYISIGLLNRVVVLMAHTLEEDRIRVISMRKATRYEAELYFASLGN
jgi:uncharacterized DUF497 family protein